MASDADFQTAVAFVLQQEGGYVNNPADPGGETKYGISKRDYPALDIPSLTIAEASGIYYTDYWTQSGAAGVDMPLAMIVLDTGVNLGNTEAQRLLGQTTDPGQYLRLRQARYQELAAANPKLQVFLTGWYRRLTALGAAAGVQAWRTLPGARPVGTPRRP